MNRVHLKNQIDNFTVGTHSISNELKDYLNDNYYEEDKENDNLVIYDLRIGIYGLVIDNEIIVSDDYDSLFEMFSLKSKEIKVLPKSIKLLLTHGLTTKQAYEIHELIKKEILEK